MRNEVTAIVNHEGVETVIDAPGGGTFEIIGYGQTLGRSPALYVLEEYYSMDGMRKREPMAVIEDRALTVLNSFCRIFVK